MMQTIQSLTVLEEKKHHPNPGRNLKMIGYILICAAGLLYLAPLLWLFDASFRPQVEIFSVPPPLFQKPIWQAFHSYTLKSFIDATQLGVPLAVINSVLLVVLGIIATLLVVSLAAYAFACMRFPGKNFLFIIVIATMMLPNTTMMAPVYHIFRVLGLTDSLGGLVLLYAASAYGFFLMRQYIIALPMSLMESAAMDGANKLQIWWNIILPLSKPALAALAIIQFRTIWNDFLIPMIVLKSETIYTIPLRLQLINSFTVNPRFDVIMATGFIAVSIPLIFFLIFQRQFIEGLSGGIKG
jgi:ABC-type glycerol-3-phosphate transport system permease component